MRRVVLDTNIIISGFISPQTAPARLLLAVRDERIVMVTSQAQLVELADVIGRPRLQKYLVPGAIENFRQTIHELALVVTAPLPAVTASPDPDDNLILATAVAGNADWVVTGDKRHLLLLGRVEGIEIVSAAVALQRLESA